MISRHISRRRSLVTLVTVVLVSVILVWQRQNIVDEIRLHTYTPTATISSLVQDDELTPYAKKLLYINQPELISSRKTFNTYCPVGSEQTIVLGCYHAKQNGIYLFAVSDSQLNGVEQVTTAHEMLHAAYDRLSSAERTQVDGWLEDYYQHDLHDPRVLSEIAAYKKTEPNAVVNEMHSVFGTEIVNLPPQLETYYDHYFVNRQRITDYAAAYQQNFTTRETEVTQDDTQLAQLKTTITTNEAALQTQSAQLSTELQNLEQTNAAGDIDSYNVQVPGYNQAVTAYNKLITTTKSLIDQYNQLVATRNSIALQAQNLENELSGTLTPLAQQ